MAVLRRVDIESSQKWTGVSSDDTGSSSADDWRRVANVEPAVQPRRFTVCTLRRPASSDHGRRGHEIHRSPAMRARCRRRQVEGRNDVDKDDGWSRLTDDQASPPRVGHATRLDVLFECPLSWPEKDGRQSASRRRRGVTIKSDAVVLRHATYNRKVI